MFKAAALSVIATSLVGCASILNDTSHAVRVETKTPGGQVVTGADCKATNDYGTFNFKSGDTVQIRRSGKDLDFVCTHPGDLDATGRSISRVNAGFAGNILIGGGIGAIIDHSKGTAYTYPTWVQLVFGKSLVFDRTAEKDGYPVPPMEVGTVVTAAGATAGAAN
jgi:hypothetical protein